MPETLDCLIVGAGPAGLVAATYLARYRRRIAVVDAGASRARWIPTSHNCPGFPLGVSGTTLLARLREQAEEHGVVVTHGRIESLAREPHAADPDTGVQAGGGHAVADGAAFMFVARDAADGEWRAPAVILATGILDRLPEVEGGPAALADAIEAGTLRLCAICDAYEARDSRIAVLAPGEDAKSHAAFLRTFSRTVDAIDSDAPYRLECDGDGCRVDDREYDTLYPALGGDSQSQLAQALGAAVDQEGALRTDAHQQTSVAGLYAIGDVVSALNQIAVAVGHAAIAATAVHNRLPPNPRSG